MNNFKDEDEMIKYYLEMYFGTPSTKIINKKKEYKKNELSIQDKLNLLMCEINYSLDAKNKAEFEKCSLEYNKLKLQLI
jgi:hypothetical protein